MPHGFYKHVIWDWNGTLINDVSLTYMLFLKEMELCNVPQVSLDVFLHKFHHPIIEFYEELGVDFSKRPYQEITDHFHSAYWELFNECRLFDDAVDILATLQAWNVSQSILSACPQNLLNDSVSRCGLKNFFSDIIGLKTNAADSKVANGVSWFKTTSYNKSDLLMVGDTGHDFQVAEALGIDCILIARGCQHYDRLKTFGVPVFKSLSEMKFYLAGMRSADNSLVQNA